MEYDTELVGSLAAFALVVCAFIGTMVGRTIGRRKTEDEFEVFDYMAAGTLFGVIVGLGFGIAILVTSTVR